MDAKDVIANPAAFGITWDVKPVAKREGAVKVELRAVPQMVVSDVPKFRETVPNADAIIASHLNGSSIRVHAQSIAREAVLKNRKLDDTTLKAMQINGILLAIRMVRQSGPKTWKTPAGVFTDRTEAVAQTCAWFMDESGLDKEIAMLTAEKVVSAQD